MAQAKRLYWKKTESRCIMVNLEHENSSLRLFNAEGHSIENVRTFSGVRRNMTREQVNTLISGVNGLIIMPATNATMTTRAVMVKA